MSEQSLDSVASSSSLRPIGVRPSRIDVDYYTSRFGFEYEGLLKHLLEIGSSLTLDAIRNIQDESANLPDEIVGTASTFIDKSRSITPEELDRFFGEEQQVNGYHQNLEEGLRVIILTLVLSDIIKKQGSSIITVPPAYSLSSVISRPSNNAASNLLKAEAPISQIKIIVTANNSYAEAFSQKPDKKYISIIIQVEQVDEAKSEPETSNFLIEGEYTIGKEMDFIVEDSDNALIPRPDGAPMSKNEKLALITDLLISYNQE